MNDCCYTLCIKRGQDMLCVYRTSMMKRNVIMPSQYLCYRLAVVAAAVALAISHQPNRRWLGEQQQ